ncbi:MAG: apolipoprotein N-acyltransferase [Acidobacteria bacterium]|nr:apolipoprotein N-acyltransferase [Acidobacteriota bacterium]
MPSRALDYFRAALSGVLLALSFPKVGHPAIAWIALAPLLTALAQEPRSRFVRPPGLTHALRLGLLTGVIYFAGTLYWITGVMAVYGGLAPWIAVFVNAALILYLSLFPGIFAVIVRRLFFAIGQGALLAAPVVWIATELGRTYLFTGFPWVLLGYSQASVLPIAQLASLFGVWGVSMLVAAVSAVLASWVAGRTPAGPSRWVPATIVFGLVLGVAVWGSRRAASAEWTREGVPVRVGLIQGNVDQGQKWSPESAAAIFDTYLRMTRQAIGGGAEFVLWPESSTPFRFEEDQTDADRLRALARQARVPILFGSDQVEWRVDGTRRVVDKYFNSAFLMRSDGTTAGVYRKMHLVPFGEYVPLQQVFFFAAPLTEQVGTFAPGADAVVLPVGGHPISVAICYEVVYPGLVRQFVAGGSELLTTITNDAWFGPTSAPYQHFEQASMRAIEEGRYLVRAANTGISGIVDPYGRVVARSGIYEPAVLVGEARYLRTSTFYARHGDVLPYASALMTLALLVLTRRTSRTM